MSEGELFGKYFMDSWKMSPPAGFAIHTYNPALAIIEMKPAKSISSPPAHIQHIIWYRPKSLSIDVYYIP